MADSGWVIVGTGVNTPVGDRAWSNPGNITADDGVVADVNLLFSFDTSQALDGSNLGLSIPATDIVTDVGVRVDISAVSGSFLFARVQLLVGGNIADITPAVGLQEVDQTVGDWGVSLTGSDVNASTFGARLTLRASADSTTMDVDYVALRVQSQPLPKTRLLQQGIGGRPYAQGAFEGKAEASGPHPFIDGTRLMQFGIGGRPYAGFTPKDPAPDTTRKHHPFLANITSLMNR